MKSTAVQKKILQKLADQGVKVEPGSRAARGVKAVSTVSAEVATKGAAAVRTTRSAIGRAVESARAAIHEATKPAPAPAPRAKSKPKAESK